MIKLKTRRTRSRIFNIFKTIMVYVKSIHVCGTKRKFTEIDIDSGLATHANKVVKYVSRDDDEDDDDDDDALETIKFFRRVSHLLPPETMLELESLYHDGYMASDTEVNRGVNRVVTADGQHRRQRPALIETMLDHNMISHKDYVKLRSQMPPITWEDRLRFNLLQQQTQNDNGQKDSQVCRQKRVCKVGTIC